MERTWQVFDQPPPSFYEAHPTLNPIVATLLYHRNLTTPKAIETFLNPNYVEDLHDPYLFKDMEKAVQRIFGAIEKNEKIIIHGDYDADGVSASVILTDLFRALDFHNFDVFLPHREKDGYGLNTNTVQILANQGTKLIITCDCGISNVNEIALANEKGMDVIITDHHTIPPTLPPAYAIIHPKIAGETYPDKNLAGGGVAFKLMQGILKKHRETNERLPNGERHEALEKWSLDMAAIASVADIVPLIGESRTLTHYGLIVLNKTRRLGLQKLLLAARLMDEHGALKYEIDADTIGFRIAPRINAAGRMEHASVGYRLLSTNDPLEAVELAGSLDDHNQERQRVTDAWVKDAVEQIETSQKEQPVLFVIHKEWTTGIVGLIASRLKEKYYRPVIAMAYAGGNVVGSGRSVEGFDLVGTLQTMPQFFQKFGGHPMACGFTLVNEERATELQQTLIAAFTTHAEGKDLTPAITIDAEIRLEEVDWELYAILDKFEPFGQGNPKPKYCARNLTVNKVEPVGADGKHLRLLVQDGAVTRKMMGWRLCNGDETNWCQELKQGDKIDAVFEIDINEWNGNRELQLTIVDLKKL